MKTIPIFLILLLSVIPQTFRVEKNVDGVYEDELFVAVKFNPGRNIVMCYKNSDGEILGNFSRLNNHIKSAGKQLVFACNGGMFMEDLRPLGLYVEDGRTLMPLNTRSASTNFYIKPNGVFYVLEDGTFDIKTTQNYSLSQIKPLFATQSGPMLVVDSQINKQFSYKSTSYNYRNGVGVQQDGSVVFVLSKVPVNFYEFACIFHDFGCVNALYLDGNVSDFYCPEIGYTGMHAYMSVFISVTK